MLLEIPEGTLDSEVNSEEVNSEDGTDDDRYTADKVRGTVLKSPLKALKEANNETGIDNKLNGGIADAIAALDVSGAKALGTEEDALDEANREVGIDNELDGGTDDATAALDVSSAKEPGTEKDALDEASREVGIDNELDGGTDKVLNMRGAKAPSANIKRAYAATLDASGPKALGAEEDNARRPFTIAIDKLGSVELKPPTIAKLAKVPAEDANAEVKAI